MDGLIHLPASREIRLLPSNKQGNFAQLKNTAEYIEFFPQRGHVKGRLCLVCLLKTKQQTDSYPPATGRVQGCLWLLFIITLLHEGHFWSSLKPRVLVFVFLLRISYGQNYTAPGKPCGAAGASDMHLGGTGMSHEFSFMHLDENKWIPISSFPPNPS